MLVENAGVELNSYERKLLAYIEGHPKEVKMYDNMLTYYQSEIEDGKAEFHGANKQLRNFINRVLRTCDNTEKDKAAVLQTAYRRSLLLDAKTDFDAYCLYIESARMPDKQFYLPRRKVLGPIAKDMQRLADGELKLLTISLPPGVGKSTLALFFITWLGGKHPDKAILTFSHDAGIVRGFYDEVLRIISPGGEYLWRDVFPASESPLVGTNAKELRIDLGKNKRFETFQFSSVGSGNAGKYRAAQLLYMDDLCEGIEQALSKDRMDKLWQTYNTDLRQRKSGSPPELHIATRWSIWDVIGRIQSKYEDHPSDNVKFWVIPALDENGESNFDYPLTDGKFTTADYEDLREDMEPADWDAIYMGNPIERKGQLFNADELRRFFELPKREPDAIYSICDTKEKGTDYAFLPVVYVYGNDWYLYDCICDNGDPKIVEERLAQKLVEHHVHEAEFESNKAGWKIAETVQGKVAKMGGRTHITTKFTSENKETKIYSNSSAIKKNFLFLDSTMYKRNSDYGRMMNFLVTYTMMGKNKHDDVPDGLSMYAEYMDRHTFSKVEVMQRPI